LWGKDLLLDLELENAVIKRHRTSPSFHASPQEFEQVLIDGTAPMTSSSHAVRVHRIQFFLGLLGPQRIQGKSSSDKELIDRLH
jgi:hypothetical protein